MRGLVWRLGGGLPEVYCLKCDVSKYFESIDHEVLLSLIQKKIADGDTRWLIEKIIRSSNKQPGKGIPIGNLTSQLFANITLNALDQYMKHALRERYYIRYMDDIVVLNTNKKRLHDVRERVETFLRDELRLRLHPEKAHVFPARAGIDFLGYRVFRTHRLLRKSTVRRFVKRTRRYQAKRERGDLSEERFVRTLRSWNAYALHGHSWRLRGNMEHALGIRMRENAGPGIRDGRIMV